MKRIFLGVTGASGATYAQRLAMQLIGRDDCEVLVAMTDTARRIADEELGIRIEADGQGLDAWLGGDAQWLDVRDVGAGPASGSYRLDAMAVIPCSMRTLGAIASGVTDNLIVRAADVCLKEHRPLVVVPRETPFNTIHLENMLRIDRAGGIILPACPAFYQNPKTLDDLVDSVVERVMTHLGVGG
jgi:4-hydroxy-3-polyprenylbenzoate decarboxylase